VGPRSSRPRSHGNTYRRRKLTTATACLAAVRTLEYVTTRPAESPELVALLAGRQIAVLTGAGMSTDSGIPDYRGPDSPPSSPMTIRQFTSDPVFRQRYWARNHVGWRHMDHTLPNAGHRALAALEDAGVVSGLITQNVDLLHTKAGSRNVIDLHGTYAQVICLSCGHTMSRAALAEQLEALNPGFIERAEAIGGLAVAPDADAVVGDTASFRYLDCPHCAGTLKPDIVYFGENVPKETVAQSYSLIDHAEALLVAGSSLTVFSGYRFVRRAVTQGIPVAIVNRGHTRGDELATVKVDGGCSELLVLLANELLNPSDAGLVISSPGPHQRP
jgi:NAD-dependent SIR2 family protein deacetylase